MRFSDWAVAADMEGWSRSDRLAVLGGSCALAGYATAIALSTGSVGPQLLGLWLLVTLPAIGAAWVSGAEDWSDLALSAGIAAAVVAVGLAVGAFIVWPAAQRPAGAPPRALLDAALWLPLALAAGIGVRPVLAASGAPRWLAIGLWSVTAMVALFVQPIVYAATELMQAAQGYEGWALAGPSLGLLLIVAVITGERLGDSIDLSATRIGRRV